AGLQALRLRALDGGDGRRLRAAALRTVTALAATPLLATVAVAAPPTSSVAALAVPATPTAAALPLRRQRRGAERLVPTAAERLEALGLLAVGALRRDDGGDLDAVDEHLRLDLEDVTDLRLGREDGGGHRPLRGPGTGGTPGPGSVVARARQLDVHPAGHGGALQRRGGRRPRWAHAWARKPTS